MKTMLECPRPVLGPTTKKKFGNSGTVVPLYAAMPTSAKRSPSVRPVRPVTWWAMGMSVVKKPVATTSTSISRSVPSAVTMPVGVTRAIRSVTSSTLSEATAG